MLRKKKSEKHHPSETIKYLRVTLTKQAGELYDKNCKSLKKETEEDTGKGKYISCSLVG